MEKQFYAISYPSNSFTSNSTVIGVNNHTVNKNTLDSLIPNECFSGSFIKASRPNGFLARNFSASAPLSSNTLISSLNSATVQVANAYAAPAGQYTYNIVPSNQLTASYSQNVSARPTMGLTVPSGNFYSPGNGGTDSPAAAAFRTAVADLHTFIGTTLPGVPSKPALNLAAAAGAITQGIEPGNAMLAVANNLISIISVNDGPVVMESIKPVMECPKIEIPAFKYLYDFSPDLIMPNLNGLPQNSVSIMELNRKEIEAFMVGMNHEMASELLWREYPTDQRGTVFSRFFGSYKTGDDPGDYDITRVIKPIHTWRNNNILSNLGDNKTDQFNPAKLLVLAIRGELLKKYPNTIIYAQTAKWQYVNVGGNMVRRTDLPRIPTVETDTNHQILMPLFLSQVSDIAFFGFDLDKAVAKGTTFTNGEPDDDEDLGWLFVFKEMMGEVHFGLDEFTETNPIKTLPFSQIDWDNVNWGHMGNSVEAIKFVNTSTSFHNNNYPLDFKWNRNAADFSAILMRNPAFICIHAKELLS